MTASLGAVERGCGYRQEGACYGECAMSDDGMPIEYFLQDPPMPLPEGLGVSPVGVTLFDINGVTHVVDWVGSDSYPNVADFIEETSRLGLSRRFPKTLAFERLSPASTIILVHGRAILSDWRSFEAARLKKSDNWRARRQSIPDFRCPKDYVLWFLASRGIDTADRKERAIAAQHLGLPESSVKAMEAHISLGTVPTIESQCASFWWEDLEGGTVYEQPPDAAPGEFLAGPGAKVIRRMPSFAYIGFEQRKHLGGYKPGIFLRMPLTNLAVIRDREGKAAELRDEIAGKTDLGVSLEDV